MSNVNAPRGFKPVRLVGGTPYTGAVNTYRLPSGYTSNLFVGDVVKLLTTGYVAKANAGDQMRGVVAGFYWSGANNQPSALRYWAASGASYNSADVEVQVIDDPNVVFEAQFANSGSVPAVADIGAMFNLYAGAGNASTGASGEGVDYGTLTTSAAQFRFLDFVKRVDNDPASAYSRGLFVPGLHDLNVTTGI